jgi:hypothetical protein
MLQGMKSCRCGRRIPSDWQKCHTCHEWVRSDLFYGGKISRAERFQLIRVKQKLGMIKVDPTWDDATKEAVLLGVANMAQAANLAAFRKRLKALQHIQVMWRNAQAYNLDVLDHEAGR